VQAARQFSLFEMLDADGRLSNTIELYDSLPKYVWGGKREHTDLQQAEVTRPCRIRGRDYSVTIKPAIIKKGRTNVLIYPGIREEVVEDALRKFATAGQGQMVQSNAVVSFTISQLQAELKSMGHTYSPNEIKEAINVCRGATIECSTDAGETVISSSFFPTVGLTTRADYLAKKDARCFVQFNPLVSKSIIELSFRQYDYRLGMELPSPLARYIYKRMSHYWVQASEKNPYTPSLVSFLSQSPRGLSEDMYTNTRAMANALDLLVKRNVIKTYDFETLRKGKKVLDVRYRIYPHEEFIANAKHANWRANAVAARAEAAAALAAARRLAPPPRSPSLTPEADFDNEGVVDANITQTPVKKPTRARSKPRKSDA